MQSIDSMETYTCGTSKDLVSEKEEIIFNHIKNQYRKIIEFQDVIKEDMKDHSKNWS